VDLSPNETSTLVVVALGAAVLAIAIALGAQLRLVGVQTRYRVLWAGGEKDVAAVLSGQAGDIARLGSDVTLSPEEQQALAAARTGKGRS
jgi:hypothetical protein